MTPFETLGLRASADPDEIRAAYRALVKQCHPDLIQDPDKRRDAQERMVQLNLAYEEALRLATPRQHAAYNQRIAGSEAVILAEKMLNRGNPESALRHLSRATERDANWYYTRGRIYMALAEYERAHESFREAVRQDPENNQFRAGALDAAVALKGEGTLAGRLKKLWQRIKKKP